MITARIEDYLEELFLLESTGASVTVTELAEGLGITKGTVTATVQKLVELDLVRHERYGALHLTPEGRRMGMVVSRRHEGLRAFFHEMLGLDRGRSSEMACSMEHYLDEVTEERLYALLEYFRRARADHEPWVEAMFPAIEKPIQQLPPLPLTLCEAGAKGTILRLTAGDALRKDLGSRGFLPGKLLTLQGTDGQTYSLQMDGTSWDLPLNEAATIWIQGK